MTLIFDPDTADYQNVHSRKQFSAFEKIESATLVFDALYIFVSVLMFSDICQLNYSFLQCLVRGILICLLLFSYLQADFRDKRTMHLAVLPLHFADICVLIWLLHFDAILPILLLLISTALHLLNYANQPFGVAFKLSKAQPFAATQTTDSVLLAERESRAVLEREQVKTTTSVPDVPVQNPIAPDTLEMDTI